MRVGRVCCVSRPSACAWSFYIFARRIQLPGHCGGVGLRPAFGCCHTTNRRLPHFYPPEAILFLTWRLFGSLPACRASPQPSCDAGRAFADADRLLDRVTRGPLWLKDSRIANLVVETLDRGEDEYRLYERFAWVIMPNHVHPGIRPFRRLPEVTRWIKGSTARSANLLPGRMGKVFWQYETCDHCVRDTSELNRVIRYVERNPVAAGLALCIEDWPWSSAGTGRRPAHTTDSANPQM